MSHQIELELRTGVLLQRLPQALQDRLHQVPCAGGGEAFNSRWLPGTSLALVRAGLCDQQALLVLERAVFGRRHERAVNGRELQRAVESAQRMLGRLSPALATAVAPPNSQRKLSDHGDESKIWPDLDFTLIESAANSGFVCADLWDQSPVRFITDESHADISLNSLFDRDDLICCCRRFGEAETRPLIDWGGQLLRQQYVVPNAMRARIGVSLAGNPSICCRDTVGPRIHIVVEADYSATAGGRIGEFTRQIQRDRGITDSDLNASIVWRLKELGLLPLVLAVHSGNKSLHGWFDCRDASDETVHAFFSEAMRLGACRSTWWPEHWVRMPDGSRIHHRRPPSLQPVLYFAPRR